MSGYRKYVDVTVTIEGAQHVVRLKPMTFEQALSLSDSGAGMDASSEAGKNAKWRAQIFAARKMLPDVAESITPVVLDADGTEVPMLDVLTVAYFQKVTNEIATEWINKANPANPS